MAMPFILQHNENIYSVEECGDGDVPSEGPGAWVQKSPMYTSKYRSKINAENAANKNVHRTMGYAEVPLNPPDKFLKRGAGFKIAPRKKDHICPRRPVPNLPKHVKKNRGGDDGGQPTEDADAYTGGCPAVTGDACGGDGGGGAGEGGKTMKTIRKVPRYVDSRWGDTHDLKPSGLMPTYVYQKNYGKLPKYLINRIHDAALQEEQFRDSQVRRQPLCRYVTQEERGELLGGLKHNWEQLQKVYQGLPVMTDTIPKILRKTELENNLKQLEKDILLIENLPYIYVHGGNQ